VKDGWPTHEKVFDGADAVVMYCDGGEGHPALPHAQRLDELSSKGVGIGCIHYAVEVPASKGGMLWLRWMGGYFETHFSVNPHWEARFAALPTHPVASGVKPFGTNDEWYYNMRFRKGMKGVTPILTAVPPDKTRQGRDDAHGGNPTVRAAVGTNQPEHVLWVSENADDHSSRGFGTTGGHVHWNWAQDDWRKTVLNSIVWIAKGEVPKGGVESKTPTVDEMLANHDEKVPADFNREDLAKRIVEMNKAK
ncbi:MAG: ThuA domain-containing protein, partial [Planctomycetota bacterium]|nr:ThuA domain-containing protein [Planctomycetota bacterium]